MAHRRWMIWYSDHWSLLHNERPGRVHGQVLQVDTETAHKYGANLKPLTRVIIKTWIRHVCSMAYTFRHNLRNVHKIKSGQIITAGEVPPPGCLTWSYVPCAYDSPACPDAASRWQMPGTYADYLQQREKLLSHKEVITDWLSLGGNT